MNSDKKPSYNKCINCGKYIETEIKDKSLYCCSTCYEKYSCCNICNQYYDAEKTHTDSLKCLIHFDLNKDKKPFIRQTKLKLFISGNPIINIELLSSRLSNILKLPLFISEQFRIENKFSIPQIKKIINQKIETQNLSDYFIFLGNSYNIDFLSELFKEIIFDKIITIDNSNSPAHYNNSKFQICANCGNINSFFQPDYEEKSRCIVCGNDSYRTYEEDNSISQQVKNYQECKDFISSIAADKYINFNFTTMQETVNEIVKYFIYT